MLTLILFNVSVEKCPYFPLGVSVVLIQNRLAYRLHILPTTGVKDVLARSNENTEHKFDKMCTELCQNGEKLICHRYSTRV